MGKAVDALATSATFCALQPGTTATWQANAAHANLKFPITATSTSTVLYAELMWNGSHSFGGANVFAFLNNAVTFTTPSGTVEVSPNAATSQTLGASTTGTCATAPCHLRYRALLLRSVG